MSKLFEDSDKRLSKVIDYKEIKFDQFLNAGGFGKVFAGVLNGKKIGIKKITIYDNDPNKNILLKFLEREIYTLKMLSHPNIIQFYGIAEKERSLFLLTELVNGGDLHWYIKNKSIELTWRLKLKIAKDIAASMVYLHENGVIHRDLKSTNLLVAEGWIIKVCDMGLARKINKDEKSKMTICGTDDWMAPEILIGEEYDASCDVFSFGMVLIELITRENLTPRIRNEDLGIDNSYFFSKVPVDCPNELLHLVALCCKVVPSERPDAKKLFNVLEYLLATLEGLGSDYEPPLRIFKPPELHLPVADNNGSSNGNGSDDFSFPRPHQQTNINNNGNGNDIVDNSHFSFPRPYIPGSSNIMDTSGSVDNSHFSFPRPYIPGSSNIISNANGNGSVDNSHFSFPRPYQSSGVVILNEKGEEQELNVMSQKDQLAYDLLETKGGEDAEMEQLKTQYSAISFPVPYKSSQIISFNENELLSFPRPWSPPDESVNSNNGKSPLSLSQQSLLEDPKYSFPRPWTPENDSNSSIKSTPISSIKPPTSSTSSTSSTTTQTPTQTSTIRSTTTSTTAPYRSVATVSSSITKPSTSQRVITVGGGLSSSFRSTTTPPPNATLTSTIKSTATVQPKQRSSSTPQKPTNVVTLKNNNANQFVKQPSVNKLPVKPTSPPTNRVIIGHHIRVDSDKVNPIIDTNSNNINNNINNSPSNNTDNNNNNTNNNNVDNKKPVEIIVTTPRNEEDKQVTENDTTTTTTTPGSSPVHRRSRSLDIKNGTKAIIKKFEELTRFSSQQSNLVHPKQSTIITTNDTDSNKFPPQSRTLNIPTPFLNNNNNNSTVTNTTTQVQPPTSPKKQGFWNKK